MLQLSYLLKFLFDLVPSSPLQLNTTNGLLGDKMDLLKKIVLLVGSLRCYECISVTLTNHFVNIRLERFLLL